MSDKPKYDAIAGDYHRFVEGEYSSHSVLGLAVRHLLARLGNIQGQILCDVGCGDGKLANQIAAQGVQVTGVDISTELLKIAHENYPDVIFIEDDAQLLRKIDSQAFDVVISNFALMDIPDLEATYQAVHRILRAGGRFIFTITHPCFQSPHAELMKNSEDTVGRFIKQYATQGHWKSTYAKGIRGRVGAQHRTISTYLNQLLATKYVIAHIEEPTLPARTYESLNQQNMTEIPTVMLIEAIRQYS